MASSLSKQAPLLAEAGYGYGDGDREAQQTHYSPHVAPPHALPLSSSPKTFANLMLCIIGTGVLGLPYTFSTIGWASGCLVLAVSALIAYHGMMLIIHSKRRFLKNISNSQSDNSFVIVASYGDLMFHVFGPGGRATVDVLLALSTVACGISYLTFISQNLASIVVSFSSGTQVSLPFNLNSDQIFHGNLTNAVNLKFQSFHGDLRNGSSFNQSFYEEIRNNLAVNESLRDSQSFQGELINTSSVNQSLYRDLIGSLAVNESLGGDSGGGLPVEHRFHGYLERDSSVNALIAQNLSVNSSFHGGLNQSLSVDGISVRNVSGKSSCHGDLMQNSSWRSDLTVSSFLGLSWSSSTFFAWLVFPLEVALAAIPSLTYLAPFSTVADFVNMAALIAVMVSDVLEIIKTSSFLNMKAFGSIIAIPSAFGVGIYAFQSAGMMIPIELSMAEPIKIGSILGWAFVLSSILYSVFAILGYAAFGENTQQIITLNLQDGIEPMLIKAAISMALFFAFPLMLNPMCELMERRFAHRKLSIWLRASVVFVICLFATAVKRFADFLSLAGSSISCLLGFILPAALHIKVMKQDPEGNPSKIIMACDYLLIAFGVVFGAFGTTVSFMNLL